jgi:hypothetical protein
MIIYAEISAYDDEPGGKQFPGAIWVCGAPHSNMEFLTRPASHLAPAIIAYLINIISGFHINLTEF